MAQNRINNGIAQRTVTVKKSELLAKLRENQQKHTEDYEKAVEEYKAVATEEVKQRKNEINKAFTDLLKKLEENPVAIAIKPNLFFDTLVPSDHRSDYEEIIQLFEAEVSENVELTSQEFAMYYRNQFDFVGQLEQTRTFYAAKQVGFSQ